MNKEQKTFLEWQQKYGFDVLVKCSKEESKLYQELIDRKLDLPEGIHQFTDENGWKFFASVKEPAISTDERREYLQMRMLEEIKVIKSQVKFFVVLTVLNIIASVIFLFLMIS